MTDIQAGDVVVYVGREHSTCPNSARHILNQMKNGHPSLLVRGRCYTVKDVRVVVDEPSIFLVEAWNGNPAGYCAGAFRKIRPATDEFTSQIKAIRPIREDA